ncbi:MAG: class I SAM-dependent methyltransferase [Promethearchaeota archaeon]
MSVEELRKIVNKKIDEDFTHDIEFIFNTIKDLKLDKNSKILDIGTGYGIMATILALNGFDVLTGEPKEDPLRDEYYKYHEEHCHKHQEENHTNHNRMENYDWRILARDLKVENKISYCNFDAQNLDFPDNTFKAIFMYDALQHIHDKKAALKECIRILDANGLICVIETNQMGIDYYKKNYNFTINLVDPRTILNEKNILFKVIKGHHVNFYIVRKI